MPLMDETFKALSKPPLEREDDMSKEMAYMAKCKCGGMVAAVMDIPNHKADTAKEVAECIEAGYTVERVDSEEVRTAEWCECKAIDSAEEKVG